MATSQYLILVLLARRKPARELETLRVIKNKELYYGEIMVGKSYQVMRMAASLSGIQKRDHPNTCLKLIPDQ